MGGWGGISSDDDFPIRQLLLLGLGHTTSADHPQVSTGNPLKKPAGFAPMALDQIIPMGQGGSG